MFNKLGKYASRAAAASLAAYWLVIFIGTHLPAGPDDWVEISDKVMHFGAYVGLGFLLGWVLVRSTPTAKRLLIAWVIIAVYGATDEFSQMLVPRRSADVWDWTADVLGGACGLGLYLWTRWLIAKRRPQSRPTLRVVSRDAA